MICRRLRYCFLHEANNTTPQNIQLKPGCVLRTESGDIEYTASTTNPDAGSVVTETIQLKTTLKHSILQNLIGRKVIVELTDAAGHVFIVGSIQYPATYIVKKTPPEVEIVFTAIK